MAAKRAPAAKPSATDTVTVGCKLPNGLILRNFHTEKYNEAVPGGFREAQRAVPEEDTYRINGNAIPAHLIQSGNLPYGMAHGAALTPGVPREFWERWLVSNAASDLVRKGFVFAHRSETEVRNIAKSNAGTKTGLEALDPSPEAINRVVQPPRGMRLELLNDRES